MICMSSPVEHGGRSLDPAHHVPATPPQLKQEPLKRLGGRQHEKVAMWLSIAAQDKSAKNTHTAKGTPTLQKVEAPPFLKESYHELA